MSSSSLPTDVAPIFVADSSVVINLNATKVAAEIIRAFPNTFVVTEAGLAELNSGSAKGHDDAQKLKLLIEGSSFRIAKLGDVANGVYMALVDGTAVQTLDDGEAATIGCAIEVGGTALIDERKARNICAARFPNLRVLSTVDLLLDDRAIFALGRQGQVEAIFNALQNARMRVPSEHIKRIVTLIGKERASLCSSLPRNWI
jgi:predicted nucleic acid-binding protein